MLNFFKSVLVVSSLIIINIGIYGQVRSWGVEYDSEVQSDLKRKANWVNLLSISYNTDIWRGGELDVQTVSVFKTRKNRILDDIQIFSNIEEKNLVLSLFIAGYKQAMDRLQIFGGIRNLNEDYFNDDLTSLFTNSSCGIFPTISLNFPVPDFPMSSIGIHVEYELDNKLALKSSVYNGVAGFVFSDSQSLFDINLNKNGFFNISQLTYSEDEADKLLLVNVGGLFHSAYSNITDDRQNMLRKLNYTLWGSAEFGVISSDRVDISSLLQLSYASRHLNFCEFYGAAGFVAHNLVPMRVENKVGVVVNYASFQTVNEKGVELTWKVAAARWLTCQTSFHGIKTGHKYHQALMLRLSVGLWLTKVYHFAQCLHVE